MYRRGDPRWNRTLQNVTSTIEHANESTQEHLWTFTHDYVNPCFSSITTCLNACTAPCFPSTEDRRRNRARSRGRAELSFDFYDDWDEDESGSGEGLLGGWARSAAGREDTTYGAVSQPGRQRGMSYGAGGGRNRDPRFNTNAARRKSTVLHPHDSGPDPTIIPSSSYFGFLGRLPFKIGGKGLRYKPSAADLVEHPGQGRRSIEEGQPLIEDSEEDGSYQGYQNHGQNLGSSGNRESKGHRRQRSHTTNSGHTTDSLSSRGDIFPSEDELDDAVPLDDEFTMALERRTTGQWLHDEGSSGKTRGSGDKPRNSRTSTRTASSGRRSTDESQNGKGDYEETAQVEDTPTLFDLKEEEERLRLEEEEEIERKREQAKRLALKRGLASEQDIDSTKSPNSSQNGAMSLPSPNSLIIVENQLSKETEHYFAPQQKQTQPHEPISEPTGTRPPSTSGPTPHSRPLNGLQGTTAPPTPGEEQPQTAPDSSAFHVDESDFSSFAPTPNRPLSIKDEPRKTEAPKAVPESDFVPARLPHFEEPTENEEPRRDKEEAFVPARLPHFGGPG